MSASTKTWKVTEATASAAGTSFRLHNDGPPVEDEVWTDPPSWAVPVLMACYTKGSDCEVTKDDTTGARVGVKGK